MRYVVTDRDGTTRAAFLDWAQADAWRYSVNSQWRVEAIFNHLPEGTGDLVVPKYKIGEWLEFKFNTNELRAGHVDAIEIFHSKDMTAIKYRLLPIHSWIPEHDITATLTRTPTT